MRLKQTSQLTAILLSSLVLAACVSDSPSSVEISSRQPTLGETAVEPNPCAAAIDVNPCAGVAASAESTATAELAKTADQTVQYFVDSNGLAIRGTDPVAYFTESASVAGSAEFTHTWNNATWQFASAQNRDLFAANPEQYAPQYGGFCAWAVSQGYTASIDPNAWRIVDGKLYLNYSQGVQRRWERDISGNIGRADANWPGVLADS